MLANQRPVVTNQRPRNSHLMSRMYPSSRLMSGYSVLADLRRVVIISIIIIITIIIIIIIIMRRVIIIVKLKPVV